MSQQADDRLFRAVSDLILAARKTLDAPGLWMKADVAENALQAWQDTDR